jgi:hypothetical protein
VPNSRTKLGAITEINSLSKLRNAKLEKTLTSLVQTPHFRIRKLSSREVKVLFTYCQYHHDLLHQVLKGHGL